MKLIRKNSLTLLKFPSTAGRLQDAAQTLLLEFTWIILSE